MVFKGVMKVLGEWLGEAALDEFEDRVDATIDNARDKIERAAQRVVQRLFGVSLLVIGIIFGLVGLAMFLSARVSALSDGIGYVVIGLVIIILALLVTRSGSKEP